MNKKRVVSKSAYVGYLAKKLGLSGIALFLIAGGVGILVLIVLAFSSLLYTPFLNGGLTILFVFGSSFVALFAVLLVKAGKSAAHSAGKLPEVVLLTQQTAQQLPAAESLVRASKQPTEQPETVLLRAAQSSAETPAEQLLRSRPGQGGE